MKRIFLLTLLLSLFIGPFCPLAVQAAGHSHRMPGMAAMDQDRGHQDMPCCWSSSGHEQTSNQALTEVANGQGVAPGFSFFGISSIADTLVLSAKLGDQHEPHRSKFETISSNKRE